MKSGVFRNGDVLIYVTSDQRVTAHIDKRLLDDALPVSRDSKVSYSKVGDTVSRNGLTYNRVEGDFGYKAEAAVAAARRKIEAGIKQVSLHNLFGISTCGKQSARKHRKLGHKVTKISNNRYTWSK